MIILQGLTVDDLMSRLEDMLDRKLAEKLTVKKEPIVRQMSKKEVAAYLRVSLPTVSKWTKDEYLRSYRLGSRILYKSNEVEVAMKERMFMRGSF